MRIFPQLFRVSLCVSLSALMTVACLGHRSGAGDHHAHHSKQNQFDSFESVWPTPTSFRTASGAPGPGYWQQQADYKIEVRIDDELERLFGKASIKYRNNSPHVLNYIWLQLDQNALGQESMRRFSRSFDSFEENQESSGNSESLEFGTYRSLLFADSFEGGYQLNAVKSKSGQNLHYHVVDTVMRIDLEKPLKTGESFTFVIEWENAITTEAMPFRHGVDHLESDDMPVYVIAQWYPRLCAYADASGWQLLPYLGSGEFALEFGNFEVEITVPSNFIVAASGELQNPQEVLTPVQRERLKMAESSGQPVMIITPEEAKQTRQSGVASDESTWTFVAENVRDFAFAASPAYIWDAKGVNIAGTNRMAMSVYPQEAAPIWQRYSTEAVAATLEGYSKFVYPYPYPVAWSCWGPVGGMEYPMVSFQSGKAEKDGTYTLRTRNYVIGVIVHEVGHNWFPMIINSDERKWMWLDEGLNSFVERLVTMEFDPVSWENYSDNEERTLGKLDSETEESIILQADSLIDRGYSAYHKPELGLMILRESILGPELFDRAMQEYANRWAFKRPIPADFFRTMEDVSGTTLDWFWRGWFYGTDALDRGIASVVSYRMDPSDLSQSKELDRLDAQRKPKRPYDFHVESIETPVAKYEHLHDFYVLDDPFAATESELEEHKKYLDELKPWQQQLLDQGSYLHLIEIENIAGLIMPMDLLVTFEDGEQEQHKIAAHIWSRGHDKVRIPIIDDRKLSHVEIDPNDPYRDRNLSNNRFPRLIETRRFHLKPRKQYPNRMQEVTKGEAAGSD